MIKLFNAYNESVRDKMTPKPKEDIKRKMKFIPNDKLFMFMWKAINTKDIESFKEYLNCGADINIRNGAGDTLLHVVCEFTTNKYIIETLLSLGINPNMTNKAGSTPIILATRKRDIEAVKLILQSENFKPFEHGQIYTCIDLVKHRYDNESTILYKILLDYELYQPFNESVRDKMTPKTDDDINKLFGNLSPQEKFDMGVTKGVLLLVKDGFENGADPNKRLVDGLTPLVQACVEGYLDVVKYLIEVCKVNPKEDWCGETPLRWSVIYGYKDIVKYLKSVKVPLNESLQDGLTMKPIEHIDSVGTFHRYNFIEDWANHEKYGKSVGYIVIDNECDLFLSSFTIWEPYKGKGLGRKYLNMILDELKKFTDYPWVGLSVKKDNDIAINLYRSVGFRNVNDVEEYEGPGKNYKNKSYYYLVKENK